MYKNKLFLATILTAFLLSGFTTATASARSPNPPQHVTLDGIVYPFPGWNVIVLPGSSTPLGESGMQKIEGRFTQFSLNLPIGPATFTSTEDSIVNAVGVGTTHGQMIITTQIGTIKAESNGKVYPYVVDNVPLGIGFEGHVATIGDTNSAMHVTGEYTGYMNMLTGAFHMDMVLKIN